MDIEYFKYNILPLKDKLFRKAYSLTESTIESQDIVQEVMIRLWDKRAEWQTIGSIEVYSMVLAKNLSLDKIKKHGRNSKSIDTSEATQLLSDLQHPQEKIEKAEQIALVWKIINQLSEREQELVRLCEIEELSYKETAKAMSLSESQVKIILFRARKKMKEIYTKISNQNGY